MNRRASANCRYQPTCYEHAANCYTHAVRRESPGGAGVRGHGTAAPAVDDNWQRLTALVYGLGLITLFLVSSIFHIISWKKSHMRLNLRELGPLAAHMRWFVWFMAAAGSVYVFKFHERYKLVELAFYLTMGFLPASVVTSMTNTEGLLELALGGLLYCLGVFFFKSDGVIPFAHAIWHVFVALAAAVHYYAIWKYLYRHPLPDPQS
ncbi:hypothetical protein CRUP_036660 [Coryphaenoides rupestris]|nr:hypothetical protein CRUP_036660 [Coryphaenoides rupestris]